MIGRVRGRSAAVSRGEVGLTAGRGLPAQVGGGWVGSRASSLNRAQVVVAGGEGTSLDAACPRSSSPVALLWQDVEAGVLIGSMYGLRKPDGDDDGDDAQAAVRVTVVAGGDQSAATATTAAAKTAAAS